MSARNSHQNRIRYSRKEYLSHMDRTFKSSNMLLNGRNDDINYKKDQIETQDVDFLGDNQKMLMNTDIVET